MRTLGIILLSFGAGWVILGALMVMAKRSDERLDEYDVPDWVNDGRRS